MTYIRVGWKHQQRDDRFEVRKVEVFRDGTKLSVIAVPDSTEIAKAPQFEPSEITREDFETVWACVIRSAECSRSCRRRRRA